MSDVSLSDGRLRCLSRDSSAHPSGCVSPLFTARRESKWGDKQIQLSRQRLLHLTGMMQAGDSPTLSQAHSHTPTSQHLSHASSHTPMAPPAAAQRTPSQSPPAAPQTHANHLPVPSSSPGPADRGTPDHSGASSMRGGRFLAAPPLTRSAPTSPDKDVAAHARPSNTPPPLTRGSTRHASGEAPSVRWSDAHTLSHTHTLTMAPDTPTQYGGGGPAPPMPPPVYAADVLIVDDSELCRLGVQLALRRLGVSFEAVEDGEDAVSLFALGKRYRLVLMDADMARMRGPDATRHIHHTLEGGEGEPPVCVYGLTGQVDEHTIRGFKEAGARDVLAKPVTASRLKEIALKLDILPRE